MTSPHLVSMKFFRTMDPLSGNLRVVGGSPRRRRVHPAPPPATHSSPHCPAGSVAARDPLADSSAHSAADNATRELNADPAGLGRFRAGCTPPSSRSHSSGKGTRSRSRSTSNTTPVSTSSSGGGPLDPLSPHEAAEAFSESLVDRRLTVGPGDSLPLEGPGLVDAINARVDLVEVIQLLIRRADEKLVQRILEQLLDLKYGKDARPDSTARPMPIIDYPTAIGRRMDEYHARMAAQGASNANAQSENRSDR